MNNLQEVQSTRGATNRTHGMMRRAAVTCQFYTSTG